MTEVDESLLALAQLREVLHGDLDAAHPLHGHTGVVQDPGDRSVLSFLDSIHDESFETTDLGTVLTGKYATDAATKAVFDELAGLASHLVGITETEYDGSAMTLVLDLLDALHNNGAPAFLSVAGNPNTGKTNLVFKLVELLDRADRVEDVPEDILVISNVRSWGRTDITCTSMHELMVTLLEHRARPKVVIIDEGSTHFDARTANYEVAQQWTPAAKRFAKIDVYATAIVAHTGKDLHPEAKRLTTLAAWKQDKKQAEFYETWGGDDDAPSDLLFNGPVDALEKADGYDPDDAAPWNWDLRAQLFERDCSWRELLDLLEERGPAD